MAEAAGAARGQGGPKDFALAPSGRMGDPFLPDDPPVPLVEHLAELRRRLIVSLLAWALATALAFHWSGALLEFLARPVGGLIFTGPTDAFMARLKVALFVGLLAALPVILAQAWLFTARALPPGLRRSAGRMIPASYGLFLAGGALAYFVVLPAAMRFLMACGSDSVKPLLAVGSYIGFAAVLCASFGAVFQLPLVLLLLNRAGVVSRAQLSSARSYFYVAAFLAAAFLTPGPDVFSQVALAVPTIILFETTLLVLQ